MKCIYLILLVLGFTYTSIAQPRIIIPQPLKPNFIRVVDTTKNKDKGFTADGNLLATLIPPTPEAAALGKFGNTPVATYTGIPNISVPIYQIQQKDLSLNLSLSYHAGGNRLEETAPWTGLGWSLTGLGSIVRTQRGNQADETVNGYINEPTNLTNIYQWSQEQTHLTELTNFSNNYTSPSGPIDTEPDIFTFNFGGYSGKFIYDKTIQQYYSIPLQKLKIVPNSTYTNWTITTPEGIQYVFSAMDMTTSVTTNCGSSIPFSSPNVTTAWHLTQIISPTDPSNTITINYSPNNFSIKTHGSSQRTFLYLPTVCQCPANTSTACQVETFYTAPKVSEILFRNGKITFEGSATNRCDIAQKSLSKMNVYDALNNRRQSTQLYYSYFGTQQANSGACATSSFTGRLRLDSLKTFGQTDEVSTPAYVFEYSSTNLTLPPTNSFEQDHWGFWNGQSTNISLLPEFRYPNLGNQWLILQGANRDTQPTYAGFGHITRITYPTGGNTAYEFESNRFFQDLSTTCDPMYCLNEESQTFNRSSFFDGVSFTVENFTINQSPTCINACQGGAFLQISASGELLGTGFTDVQFRISSLSNGSFTPIDITNAQSLKVLLPNGNYRLQAFYNGVIDSNTLPQLQNTVCLINWKQALSSEIPVGGLRVKKITDYDPIGNLTQVRKYQYTQEGSSHSSAKIVQFPYYGQILNIPAEVDANGIPGGPPDPCVNTFCSVIKISSESTYPLIATQGAAVGYTRVEEIFGENGENGKTIHTFTPIVSFRTNYNFPIVPVALREWQEGLPQTNLQQQASNLVLQADSSHYAFAHEGTQNLEHEVFGLIGAKFTSSTTSNGLFTINGYRTPTNWFYKDFMEQKSYHTDGVNFQQTSQWFGHNTQNFQTSTLKTLNSAGDTLKTEMKYPHDFASNTTYAGMILKNQLNAVIEQNDYVWKVGSTSYEFLKKKKTNFAQFHGAFYAPATLETQYSGGSLTQEMSINYANDALITSISERNGITTALTWYGASDIGKRDLLKTMVKADGNGIAQTTSYDYQPLVGMITQTDPRGLSSTFEYDALNRLQTVKDATGKILKNYSYQYANDTPSSGTGGGCTTPAPVITAAPAASGCQSVLTASACVGGTITWSNGQTGTSITVPSVLSPVYTATCTTTCTSLASNAVAGLTYPAGWTADNIVAAVNGCVVVDNTTFRMQTNTTLNKGIGGSDPDHHYFFSKIFSGDVTIMAKVNGLSAGSGIRAGLMFKAGLGSKDVFFSIVQDGDNSHAVGKLYRETTNANAFIGQYQLPLPANVWLRIKKAGTSIRSYYSTLASPNINQESDWIEDLTTSGSALPAISFGSSFRVGLTLENPSSDTPTAQVTFTNVQINDNGNVINP
jgi:RHS Repeat